MPLKEEVIGILIGGASIIIGFAILSILYLWLKNKNYGSGYFWVLLHLLFFSIAIYFY